MRAPPRALREAERWLLRQIALPDGRRARAAPRIEGDRRLSADARLSIYASMYRARLGSTLREDFPRCLAILGERRFDALAGSYFSAHPSRHPSLRHAGDRFAPFLARRPEGRRAPWLVEIARLERAIVNAFDAPDAAPVTREALARIPASRWAGLRFALQPALSRLRFAHRLDEILPALDRGRAPEGAPRRERCELWVFRRGFTVRWLRPLPPEARALAAVARGEPFGRICERYGDAAPAAAALAGWVDEELLVERPVRARGARARPGL